MKKILAILLGGLVLSACVRYVTVTPQDKIPNPQIGHERVIQP